MRKTVLILSLGVLCASILSGCKSKNRYKTPTNPHDKVQVAFNGVEKSFANYKDSGSSSSSSKTTRSIRRIGQSDTSGALSDIASIYTSYDSQGDRIDDLEFDQPPMVQFQCLKKVFETIGGNYSFGTKYADTIYGTAYFDPSTGDQKAVNDTYKYDYAFTLSLQIDIDSNDLINADVSFDIKLTHDSTTIKTNWYVAMVLDYEMSIESPTYTLSMFTDNNQDELEFREYGNTYEYDYVDMKDGRINEWRKFCYEVNKRMIKDANHPTFSTYLAETDFEGQIGASKWYKNGDLRKISHPNSTKTKTFIAALFDKFGLNTTDINGASFLNKIATQNSAIQQVYKGFSDIFKQDVIYNLITHNGKEITKVKDSIRVMDYNVQQQINKVNIEEDTTLRTLFDGEENHYGIWYFDQNQEAIEQIENLDNIKLNLTVSFGNSLKADFGNEYLDHKISDIFKSLGKDNFEKRYDTALLTITDELARVHTFIEISLGDQLSQSIKLYFMGFFPSELIDLGFPIYNGQNCLFELRNSTQIVLDITQTNEQELNAFYDKLELDGWTKEIRNNQNHFSKLGSGDNSSKLYQMDVESPEISEGKVRVFYKIETIQRDVWPKDDILSDSNGIFDLDSPDTKNGYFNVNTDENTVIMKNFTTSEQSAFISSLENAGDERGFVDDGGINSINVRVGDNIYHFVLYVGGSEILFQYGVDVATTYHVFEITIEKDGELFVSIPLNENLSKYYLRQNFAPGVYVVKAKDLITSDPITTWAINNTNGLNYNESTKELTLTENKVLTFSATSFSPVEIDLL